MVRIKQLGRPYLKCLTPEQGQYVLGELHEGICGNHSGGRTLAQRAHTQGYYWPNMRLDAANYVRKCDPCQRMSPILKSLVQDLISISSPWPFTQWGIDILGPLPTAPTQKTLLLVATDYFSKWIEAEAFPSLKDRDVTRSSERILSAGSAFRDQSCQIMGHSLTAGSIETSAKN